MSDAFLNKSKLSNLKKKSSGFDPYSTKLVFLPTIKQSEGLIQNFNHWQAKSQTKQENPKQDSLGESYFPPQPEMMHSPMNIQFQSKLKSKVGRSNMTRSEQS